MKHHSISDELQHGIASAIAGSQRLDEVILRGHLYVEYLLNELILNSWSDKGRKLVEGFSFTHKIAIAEGTNLINDERVLDAMQKVNALRNLVAHSLFPTGLEERIFATPLVAGDVDGDALLRSKMIVLTLCGYLAGLRDGGLDRAAPLWVGNLRNLV